MATTNATVTDQFARPDDWAFETYDTFAGAFTEVKIQGAALRYILERGKDLLVTGITANWIRGGGGASFFPRVHLLSPYTGLPISIDLPLHTTTATNDPAQYFNLEVPLYLHSGTILSLVGTTVALDLLRINVWGTYRKAEPLTKPTDPVAIKEIDVWPWKR